ncbi:hypothetical protein [Magpiepox virus 2]|nr:hypothetical protein [Magpiepox virus 2]
MPYNSFLCTSNSFLCTSNLIYLIHFCLCLKDLEP